MANLSGVVWGEVEGGDFELHIYRLGASDLVDLAFYDDGVGKGGR